MAYDEAAKISTIRYIKEKQQEIKIRYKKDEFEQEILPAIEKTGLPVATFFKLAVAEKIKADSGNGYKLESVLDKVKSEAVKGIRSVLRDDCKQIILYGSCARGDYSEDSDVDIAILTKSDREEVKKYSAGIDEVAAKIGVDTLAVVNFVCLPAKEFEQKKDWYLFFKNIAKDGVVLYG